MTELTARTAIECAAFYGLDYRTFKEDIRSGIENAREAAASPGSKKSAMKYFEGYMNDIDHERRCDSLASKRENE